MTPERCPALLLNANHKPTYPLELWHWQDSVTGSMTDRVAVLCEYDAFVRSPSREIRIPSVIALRSYRRQDRPVALTRRGIYLRDGGKCAYCRCVLAPRDLTFDHVVPRSKGGRTTWTNCVAACGPCNARKCSKSLAASGMQLHARIYVPTRPQLGQLSLASFRPHAGRLHPTWLQYMGIPAAEAPPPDGDVPGAGAVFPAGMTSAAYWDAALER